MKKMRTNLHMEQRRVLMMVLLFGLAFSLITIFAAISTKTDLANLNVLLLSDYEYSFLTEQPVLQDDYYQFDAGITFMTSKDASMSINADVIMQSIESDYTQSIAWNANNLDTFGVAISEGLAKSEGLQIGENVYSKHIVDGKLHRYTVEEILPEFTSIREYKSQDYHDGIIIMGYDSNYVNEISNRAIVFSKAPLDTIGSKISGTTDNIIYRTDEISAIIHNLFPYILVYIIIAIIISVGMVAAVTRDIKYNFRRLASIGFERDLLNQAYRNLIYKIGLTSILISLFALMAASRLCVFCYAQIVFLIVIMVFEMAGTVVSAAFIRRKLWR